jgi:hypothetical protein
MDDRKRLPSLSVPAAAYANLARLAKDQNLSVSQAIREALTNWVILKAGVDVDFNVGEWGGDRSQKDDETDA